MRWSWLLLFYCPPSPLPFFVNGFDLLKMDIVRSKSIYTPEPTLPMLSLVSGIKGLYLIHLIYSSKTLLVYILCLYPRTRNGWTDRAHNVWDNSHMSTGKGYGWLKLKMSKLINFENSPKNRRKFNWKWQM